MGSKVISSLAVEIGADTSKLEAGLAKTKTGLQDTAKSTGGLKDLMSGLGVSLPVVGFSALGAGIAATGKFIADSIKDVSEYNRTIMLLSQNLSLTSEETSRIVQTADDFGISIDQVKTSLQFAAKNGFAPTIENLANLADHLKTVQDPTVRAAELTKIFGRSWSELTPLLNAGGDAIRDGSAAIEDGLIVTQEAINQSEELRLAQDKLSDSWTVMKNEIGNAVTPALSALTSGIADNLTASNALRAAVDKGALSFAQAGLLAEEMTFHIKTNAEVQKIATDAIKANTKAVEVDNEAIQARRVALDGMIPVIKSTQVETYLLGQEVKANTELWQGSSAAYYEAYEKTKLTKDETAKLTAGVGLLALGMSNIVENAMTDFHDKTEALKIKTGELKDKIAELERRKYLTADQRQELDDLQKELVDTQTETSNEALAFHDATAKIIFDLMQQQLAVDGVISQDDLDALTNYARNEGLLGEKSVAVGLLMQQAWKDAKGDAELYGRKVKDITDAVANLNNTIQNLKDKQISIDIYYNKHMENEGGSGYPYGKASGGPVMAGSPYIVGEAGPELFVPNQSGQIIPNNQVNNRVTNINVSPHYYRGSEPSLMDELAIIGAFSRA